MGGIVGAALGALLTGKSRGAMAAGLGGAAIAASLKAYKESQKVGQPISAFG